MTTARTSGDGGDVLPTRPTRVMDPALAAIATLIFVAAIGVVGWVIVLSVDTAQPAPSRGLLALVGVVAVAVTVPDRLRGTVVRRQERVRRAGSPRGTPAVS